MKIKKMKKILSGMCGLSLSLCVSSAALGSEPEGPAPNLSMAEEGGFVLAESLLSITAALITKSGCFAVNGGAVSITVDQTGSGSAAYPAGGQNPIALSVAKVEAHPFGNRYAVNQAPDTPGFLGGDSIQNYAGELTYSTGSAILISNSVFEIFEFTVPVLWDEHNIKDFWLSDGTGQHISDVGLEVITKLTYPITKWKQRSQHWRQNGGPGEFTATKHLITPFGQSCWIAMDGVVPSQFLGTFSLNGNITVLDTDPTPPPEPEPAP